MDNPSTQIRVVKPVAPDRAEVSVYCIAPVGEPAAARAARLRKFEDFYLTFGMATSDDMAALEDSYEGSKARLARWNDLGNGMATLIDGPDEDARRLGFTPASSNVDWQNETLYYGFYRRWRRMLSGGGRGE
jgi:benzoate/toluate 1,2-dioxygenase alpha subunit